MTELRVPSDRASRDVMNIFLKQISKIVGKRDMSVQRVGKLPAGSERVWQRRREKGRVGRAFKSYSMVGVGLL